MEPTIPEPMPIFLVIPGKPVEKKTARFKSRGGKKPYDPQKAEKEAWLWEAIPQIRQNHYKEMTGPLKVCIDFIMPVLKNTPQYKLKQLEEGKILWHIVKPDTDNLVKWVGDCLTKILWHDDSQIVILHTMKRYGIHPRTEINVEEL